MTLENRWDWWPLLIVSELSGMFDLNANNSHFPITVIILDLHEVLNRNWKICLGSSGIVLYKEQIMLCVIPDDIWKLKCPNTPLLENKICSQNMEC